MKKVLFFLSIITSAFSSISGVVTWESNLSIPDRYKKYTISQNSLDNLPIIFHENRYWLDAPSNEYTDIPWDAANLECQNNTTLGFTWRLPTCEEARIGHFFKNNPGFRYDFLKQNAKFPPRHFARSVWTDEKDKSFWTNSKEKECRTYTGNPKYQTFMCIAEERPDELTLDFEMLHEVILNDIYQEMFKINPESFVQKTNIPFQEPQQKEGESEEDYKTRLFYVKEEQRILNQFANDQYENALKQWKQNLLTSYQENVNENIDLLHSDFENKALSLAFFMIHGKPIISEVNYNDSTKELDIKIKGSKSGMTFVINLPTSSYKSHEIKDKLMDNNFHPTFVIYLDNNLIQRVYIKELLEPKYEIAEEELARAYNYAYALEDFLIDFSSSNLTDIAKNRLNEIKNKNLLDAYLFLDEEFLVTKNIDDIVCKKIDSLHLQDQAQLKAKVILVQDEMIKMQIISAKKVMNDTNSTETTIYDRNRAFKKDEIVWDNFYHWKICPSMLSDENTTQEQNQRNIL